MKANVYRGANGLLINNKVIHLIENDKVPDVNKWFYDRVKPLGLNMLDYTILNNNPEPEKHHLCHAYAAYSQSGFTDASILVIDGMNKLNGISIGIYTATDDIITEIKTYPAKYSLGSFYSNGVVTSHLGVDDLNAGKLMGLSSYASPTKDCPIFFTVDKITGEVNDCVAEFIVKNNKLELITHIDDYMFKLSGGKLNNNNNNFNFTFATMAANVQYAFEQSVFSLLEYMSNNLPSKNLVISGGCALNCVMNGKIIRSNKWNNLFIPNMCEDKGNIIGIMAMDYKQKITKPFIYNKVSYPVPKEFNKTIAKTKLAELLRKGTIVAWFEGGSEYGPRALCHRSLLANPELNWIGYRLNEIKHREYWRPLAPVVLDTHFEELFDVDGRIWPIHKTMLATEYIRDECARSLQPICAADNSSRPQILTDNEENHTLYTLMKQNNLPILINTSMNDAGESICEFPEDAINFCSKYPDVLLVFVKDDIIYTKDKI